MAWKNGTTDFGLAALIILLLLSVVAFVRLVLFPLYPAKFGARLPADGPQVAQVQVGVDAATGQPIYQQQQINQAPYHWALSPSWLWGAICIQGVIFILFLSAMSADSWSSYSTFGTLINYGVVRVHATGSGGSGSYSYADLCDSVSGDDRAPCGTVRATGAFTLIFSLFALFNSLLLLTKATMTATCATQHGWNTWQYQLAWLQSVLFGFIIFIWALGGQVVIKEAGSANLGSSWGLTLTCWIISQFMLFYYKNAIEYRRNGDPVQLAQAPVASVVLMQQPAGTVIIQQPSPVVMMSPPAVMVAQPQPQYAQPAYQPQQQQPQQHYIPQNNYPPQQVQPQFSPQQGGYPAQQYQGQPQQMQHQGNYAQASYPGQQQQPMLQHGAPPPYAAQEGYQGPPAGGQIPVTFAPVNKQ